MNQIRMELQNIFTGFELSKAIIGTQCLASLIKFDINMPSGEMIHARCIVDTIISVHYEFPSLGNFYSIDLEMFVFLTYDIDWFKDDSGY